MPEMRGSANHKGTFAGAGIPPERWSAIIVVAALGLLILIRMGFRGVNVFGVSASVN